jgi:RecB family exonuclease
MDVIEIITSRIHERNTRFVFPSETAAALWARKACGLAGVRSVAANRFLAWDRFKEEAVRAEVRDKRPVPAVLRRLFAEDLARKNAACAAAEQAVSTGQRSADAAANANVSADVLSRPPFRALIPPEFAEDGAVFAASIAAMLPSLSLWENRQADLPPDDEDRDLRLLKNEYTAFLERSSLFEPAWEKPPLRDREHDYYIFFYEAMEDFEEFEELLRPEKTIHLIETPKDGNVPLYLYKNSRAEIRAAALEIRFLHEEKGIPWEDIAVSVPGYEDMEPYLLREFSLYHIPCRSRSGRSLGDYNTGRFFSLASLCTANNFSFASLKALILNEHLPWRCPDLNRELIEFGIKNNCVSGYREDGVLKDIWIEAFRQRPGEKKLQRYYRKLKNTLKSMTEADDFSGIRKHYFAFRGPVWKNGAAAGPDHDEWEAGFFAREAVTPEGDAALARCVEELSALIRLEGEYAGIMPQGKDAKGFPFGFFLSVLREKQYVPQRREGGVNIFHYRVAAAAPFACHFVLNASQDSARVRYQPLEFLCGGKRDRLGFRDKDVSGIFFRLYQPLAQDKDDAVVFPQYTRISAAEESFAGWTIPHSFFAGRTEDPPETPPDPYIEERAWWAGREDPAGCTADFPAVLFPAQSKGFGRWRQGLAVPDGNFNLLYAPFPADGAVRTMIKEAAAKRRTESGSLRVSATQDLDVFGKCPASWFYQRLLGLREFSLEAKMLDDASLGLLYHEILHNLFEKIRAEDGIFRSDHIERYRTWTDFYTRETAKNYEAFQGPLAAPVLSAQARAVSRRLYILLKTEAWNFDGYTVGDLETRFESEQNGIFLNGIIDRVSVSPDGEPVIIDYKTGGDHTKAASTGTGNSYPKQSQISLYVKLYEEKSGAKAGGACFMLINGHKLVTVLGKTQKTRGDNREKFQETLDSLELYLEKFKSAVDRLDFSSPGVPLKDCMACVYRSVCRTSFFLNSGKSPGLEPDDVD